MIDYKKESEEIENYKGGVFWKPDNGTYKVVAIGEIEDGKPFEEEGKDPVPQMELKVSIDGEEKVWTFGKGQTSASTYGQLCGLGAIDGTLNGKTINVKVMTQGKKKLYTIY